MVLWVVALLAVMAGNFALGMRAYTRATHYLVAEAKAHALAEGGLALAVEDIMKPPAKRRLRPGIPFELPVGEGSLTLLLEDEAGRVDLNAAPADLLVKLFQAAGAEDPEALADAVLDWRDPDDLRHARGAEDRDYQAAGYPYGAKDAPFDAVEELGMVMGMTPDLYRRLEDAVTVASRRRGIVPQAAPPLVRQALGLPEEGGAFAPSGTYRLKSRGRVEGVDGRIEVVFRVTGNPRQPYRVFSWREDG